AHAEAHLCPHQPAGQRFVVDARGQTRGSSRMALAAVPVEEGAPVNLRLGVESRRRTQRLSAVRGAAACQDQRGRCHEGRSRSLAGPAAAHGAPPPAGTTRHTTPVPSRGAGPCSLMVMTPKSTTQSSLPSGENLADMGLSRPAVPVYEAGPEGSRLTMKSMTTPVSGSTRTTLKPAGIATLPTCGAMSPS